MKNTIKSQQNKLPQVEIAFLCGHFFNEHLCWHNQGKLHIFPYGDDLL
jgi:hypothetical protein